MIKRFNHFQKKGGEALGKSIIRIKDVTKFYRMGAETIAAVNGLNLSIRQGEVCCLFGKSGSGKSTLLNLIAGL